MKSVQWFGVPVPCTLQPIGIGMADSHMLYAIGVHERLCISNTASSRDGLQCALRNWDKDPKPLHKSGPSHTSQTAYSK